MPGVCNRNPETVVLAHEILVYAYEGMVRTQKLLLEQELIKVAK